MSEKHRQQGRPKVFSERSRALYVRLEPEEYAKLKAEADKRGQTVSTSVRRILSRVFSGQAKVDF